MRAWLVTALLCLPSAAWAQYSYPYSYPYAYPPQSVPYPQQAYPQQPYPQQPYPQPAYPQQSYRQQPHAQQPEALQPYRPLPAPPPRDIAPSGSLSREMLNAHNAVRAQVGEAPLAWSPRLAAAAQEWAQQLIASGTFAHRPGDPYGQNLYAISGGAASPQQVVYAWADEARGYDIGSNTCTGVCGHYTQIVWRATRFLGCAVATDPEREVWVCEYDPPGNVVGYRPY